MATDNNKQGDAGHQGTTAAGSSSHSSPERPSEFKIGLVTFIIFLVFMAIWMYFRTAE